MVTGKNVKSRKILTCSFNVSKLEGMQGRDGVWQVPEFEIRADERKLKVWA